MDAQTTHPTSYADRLTEADLVRLAVAVGILPDEPVDQVHYDWTSGALVRVPAGAWRAAA